MASEPQDPKTFARRRVDDLALPFQVEKTGVRGRIVRLGSVVDQILTRHAYPDPVSEVLGEALLVAGLLGSSLKTDGSLNLQTHSDGPVSLLVASFKAPGLMRGYAMLDHDKWAALEAEGKADKAAVLGQGQLAFTLDPGAGMHRYQGIVPLGDNGILGGAQEYFLQSEQIATRLHLAVGRRLLPGLTDTGGGWRAGGVLIQHLAAEGGRDDEERQARIAAARAEGTQSLTAGGEDVEEAWSRVTMLLATTEDHELLDPLLKPESLLLRLFHEDGVRVFDSQPLSVDCRCTEDRIKNVLTQYAGSDLDDLIEDGRITVRCEFCSRDFSFDPVTLDPQSTAKPSG